LLGVVLINHHCQIIIYNVFNTNLIIHIRIYLVEKLKELYVGKD